MAFGVALFAFSVRVLEKLFVGVRINLRCSVNQSEGAKVAFINFYWRYFNLAKMAKYQIWSQKILLRIIFMN